LNLKNHEPWMLPSSSRQSIRGLSDSASESSLVGWEVDSASKVGTITLQSPQSFNALTVEMGAAFSRTVTQIRHDLTDGKQNVNAIVLQGAGEQAFSAGGNTAWLKSLHQNTIPENEELMLSFYQSFMCVRKLPVPVIVALQGPAIGAGCCLAMACDLRVAAPKPKILGFTFSRLGIHSGMGGSHLLQRLLGSTAKCNELLLTGKVIGGEEALRLGLVNEVAQNTKKEAFELAKQVASQNPMAIRTMIATLRYQQDKGLDEALRLEAKAQAICYSRDDWGEGVDAAIEKRDPVFDDYHTK
jgi:enoyl-CoA hydratase